MCTMWTVCALIIYVYMYKQSFQLYLIYDNSVFTLFENRDQFALKTKMLAASDITN